MSPELHPRIAALVRLSAALGLGNPGRVRAALTECGDLAPPREVEEVILQAYLFVGFPRVLDAMRAWRDTEPGRTARVGRADRERMVPSRGTEEWERRGEELCRVVYGDAYRKLRGNVRRLHPDLDRWMIEEGYGKVLSRPGLDVRDRELCIVALLAVQDQEPQLHSHLRGVLRVGASESEVKATLQVAKEEGGDPERAERVGRLWDRVRRRSDEPGLSYNS